MEAELAPYPLPFGERRKLAVERYLDPSPGRPALRAVLDGFDLDECIGDISKRVGRVKFSLPVL